MGENKYVVALGYISTIVPEMVIDVENPLDMMRQVYNKFDQLQAERNKLKARVTELEAERNRLKNVLNEIYLSTGSPCITVSHANYLIEKAHLLSKDALAAKDG